MDFLIIGSLLLGLVALVLPVVSIVRKKRLDDSKRSLLSVFSIGACAVAVGFQLLYQNYLIGIGDIPAVMDTIGTAAMMSVLLLVLTVLLNGLTWFLPRFRFQQSKI